MMVTIRHGQTPLLLPPPPPLPTPLEVAPKVGLLSYIALYNIMTQRHEGCSKSHSVCIRLFAWLEQHFERRHTSCVAALNCG
jgi:hypothetical protein